MAFDGRAGISPEVMRTSWVVLVAVVLASTGSAFAQPDADRAAAKRFLESRPELALANRLPTRVAAGVYRVDLGGGAPAVFAVKQGASWVGAMALDVRRHDPSTLVPAEVLGDARVRSAFVVIGASKGVLAAKGLGGEIATAVKTFGDAAYGPGVNVFTQIDLGSKGTLGELRAAGVLPSSVWLSGSVAQGYSDVVLGGAAADPKTLDFSLTIAVAAWTPPPWNAIRTPRLTLGDARFTLARTGGALAISGEQTNSKLDFGSRSFSIPRTSFTFVAKGGAYEVTVAGSTAERQPWRDAFGLAGVDVEAITIGGSISAARTGTKTAIQGFGLGLGARVAINRRKYQGEFALDIVNNKVEEVSLGLRGDLDLGFLPGGKEFRFKQFSISLSPGAGQAALAGELAWRGFTGKAAVVLSRTPMVFVKLDKLDLLALVSKTKPAGLALPPLDVVLAVGFAGKAGDVANLPHAAQEMIDEVTGTSGGKVEVGNGITVLSRIDARAIGADKLGATGSLVLAGSLDLVAGSFRLAASLPSLPAIKGLPKGFAVEAPEVFVALDRKAGPPTASFGLGMRLRVPVDRQVMVLRGSMTASTAGTFAFTGALESDWVNPLGLDGITIAAPVVATVGVAIDGSVDLGVQGGLKIGKLAFDPMAMCLNIQPAVPTPVPKKVALRFAGSELGPTTQLALVQALVKSVTNGPLKGAALDANTAKLIKQLGKGVDQIGKLADGLPEIGFKNVDVALTTPGVKCELPALADLGMKLKGTVVFLGKELGSLDASIDLSTGLRIKSKISDLSLLDIVKLEGASLDVLAPIPGTAPPPSEADNAAVEKLQNKLAKKEKQLKTTVAAIKKEKDKDDKAELEDEKQDLDREIADLKRKIGQRSGDLGHFYLKGKTTVLGASAKISVELDRTQAAFDFRAGLWDLGTVSLSARTEGDDLTHAKDFEVDLHVTNDFEKKMFDKLMAGLKASADARKKAQASIDKDTKKAQKDAQAEFDKLDATIGKDFRKAQKDLDRAKTKFRKAERDLDKAKDKCKKDLGPIGFVCDTVDAAKETVKAAKKSLDAAKDVLAGIEKSAKYAKLKTAEATLASLEAGNELVKAGLAGWAAIDNVTKLVANGVAKDLISIEEIELEGSLKKLKGSLRIKASVGDLELEQELSVSLGAGGNLDIGAFADKVADEIMAQATKENSAVWKALRKK